MARLLLDHAGRSVVVGVMEICVISNTIQPQHLTRKALLYVRQSSPHQASHNKESRTLQCGMLDRLTALGWSEIEVIDDDLGSSPAGRIQRAGFDRMVAQVCLGKVRRSARARSRVSPATAATGSN
jgi:hypothetical protein